MNDPVPQGCAAGPKTVMGEVITQYLVAIHHPDDYDSSREGEAMERDIDALNEDDGGCWCQDLRWRAAPEQTARSRSGCSPMARCSSPTGRTWRPRRHIGGFWVLEAVDLNEALARGRKAAVACRAPVEVYPFH